MEKWSKINNFLILNFKLLIITLFFNNFNYAYEITLFAPLNAINLRGNITFYQPSNNSPVQISVHLQLVRPIKNQIEEKFEWSINSNPVQYGNGYNTCNKNELGKSEFDLLKKHGEIVVGINKTEYVFINHEISLQGIHSIWSKSLYFKSLTSNAKEACTNIIDTIGEVRTAEAQFVGEVSGVVLFRENERGETLIFSNLFYVGDNYRSSSKNDWKLYVTDIFDRKSTRSCNYLSLLLDPFNTKDDNCSTEAHVNCKLGDLTRKHKQITIGAQNNRYSKQVFLDLNLPLSFIEGSSRNFYVVLNERNNNNKIMACAKLNIIRPREVKAIIDMDGVQGYFQFAQRYWLDPTIVTIKLNNLMGRGKHYSINELPLKPLIYKNQKACSNMGNLFNPFKIKTIKKNFYEGGTNDEFAIGDLSGKFGLINNHDKSYLAIYTDFNLPLFGTNSIIGRSITIKNANDDNWICGSIGYPSKLITAVATFHFPIYGKIIFKQEINKPYAETTVYVELGYSSGQINTTFNHDWKIHENFAGNDFYNWSRRCDSSGNLFNPVKIAQLKYNLKCTKDNQLNCKIGDLSMKSGKKLRIIANKNSEKIDQIYYIDTLLPLQGPHSIIGRSIVILDDQFPKQRGNRLACSNILREHELSAVVREWKTSVGVKSNVSGSITFNQQTIYDPTEVIINFYGLNGLASNYHLHEIWVPKDRHFPCSFDSIFSIYNPFELDVSVGVLPGIGSKDQYEIGDLSGKYGQLNGKMYEKKELFDTSLTLHGFNSIIGRSIVINKEEHNFQWTCGTIKSEIHKDEGRELIALISFHNDKDEISGFVRMKQFEFKDGSLSNTWIEVSLKYVGDFNKNITKNHKWSIYVNQVGSDAYIETKNVRCIAGGYRWNPYLIDSKNELYDLNCNKENQLRCEMGDLSGKLTKLTIGGKPKIFVDENLPLIGNYSVMYRSLIIFDQNDQENKKLGCANILPDIHLTSSVTVKKHLGFTIEKFMNHMRKQLNTKKWLVEADLSNTNYILKGECAQITINFYGSEAHRLQLEFSNLINLGSVIRQVNGKTDVVHTFYKPCKSFNDLLDGIFNESNKSSKLNYFIYLNLFFLIFQIIYIK